MEFRLAGMHLIRNTEYRRHYDAWVADRLLGIFFAVATGKLTDESRDSNMRSSQKGREYLLDMLSPLAVKKPHDTTEQRKRSNRSMEEYVTLLGSTGGFSSLGQLQAAIRALNETIREMRSDADPGTD